MSLFPSTPRRGPAKPMGSPRVGSNPAGVARLQHPLARYWPSPKLLDASASRIVVVMRVCARSKGTDCPGPSAALHPQYLPFTMDTLAERPRRRPAKPMGSPRVGSNPTGVDVPQAWPAGLPEVKHQPAPLVARRQTAHPSTVCSAQCHLPVRPLLVMSDSDTMQQGHFGRVAKASAC